MLVTRSSFSGRSSNTLRTSLRGEILLWSEGSATVHKERRTEPWFAKYRLYGAPSTYIFFLCSLVMESCPKNSTAWPSLVNTRSEDLWSYNFPELFNSPDLSQLVLGKMSRYSYLSWYRRLSHAHMNISNCKNSQHLVSRRQSLSIPSSVCSCRQFGVSTQTSIGTPVFYYFSWWGDDWSSQVSCCDCGLWVILLEPHSFWRLLTVALIHGDMRCEWSRWMLPLSFGRTRSNGCSCYVSYWKKPTWHHGLAIWLSTQIWNTCLPCFRTFLWRRGIPFSSQNSHFWYVGISVSTVTVKR